MSVTDRLYISFMVAFSFGSMVYSVLQQDAALAALFGMMLGGALRAMDSDEAA